MVTVLHQLPLFSGSSMHWRSSHCNPPGLSAVHKVEYAHIETQDRTLNSQRSASKQGSVCLSPHCHYFSRFLSLFVRTLSQSQGMLFSSKDQPVHYYFLFCFVEETYISPPPQGQLLYFLSFTYKGFHCTNCSQLLSALGKEVEMHDCSTALSKEVFPPLPKNQTDLNLLFDINLLAGFAA